MDAFLRPYYQERIEKYLGKDLIIILTGQRRVGKSYVLRLFAESLSSDSQNNIIFIDKEKHVFDSIKNYVDLNEYIVSHLDTNRHNFILIDEIQDI